MNMCAYTEPSYALFSCFRKTIKILTFWYVHKIWFDNEKLHIAHYTYFNCL